MNSDIVYTCPHHPEIKQNKPGICPKCGGMELVPISESSDSKDSHASSMSHGSAGEFLSKFYATTFILVPLFVFSSPGINLLKYQDFSLRKYLQFILASAIFYIGRIFFIHATHEIKMKKPGMMTLVSLGVGSGYFFSALSTFIPSINSEFYLEIASLIWVLLFGHFLEAKSSSSAGDALKEVSKLLPSKAHLISKSGITEINIEDLEKDMLVRIFPGEKVPADGKIVEGSSSFNESHITGESKLIQKKKGDDVIAGAICEDTVDIRLLRVGDNSTVGQIKDLVARARTTKPKTQALADKAAYYLTFVALSTSILTLFVWSFIVGETFVFSMTLAITVLVIACPHALGLAIPAVTTIATKMALNNGIFIKDLRVLESAKEINIVVFDKTGTLTKGKPSVSNFEIVSNLNKLSFSKKGTNTKSFLKSAVFSLESRSTHPIAAVITEYLKGKELEVSNFKNIKGKGVMGSVESTRVLVGTEKLLSEYKIKLNSSLSLKTSKWVNNGETVSHVSIGGAHVASFSLTDKIKKESIVAIESLHNLGITTVLLTGDTKESAALIGKRLKLDEVFAEVLPKDKYKKIKSLQAKNKKVMMVGDGVNDAPALTQSDIGIAIGAGTDVAVESGDVVLTRSNPMDVVSLLKLSRLVYRKMIENLLWALGYNAFAIPAAAGLFIPWGLRLRPEWGALLMSLSSVIVAINAFSLKNKEI